MTKAALAFAAALLGGTAAQATTIAYPDFSSTSGLSLNGAAAATPDASGRSVLRLTPSAPAQSGSAFSTSTIPLSASLSFSAAFGFNINQPGGCCGGADGIVFVVQTNSNNVGGSGGGIGYEGVQHSVGVKFDTFQNSGDLSDNFVGVVLGGNINAVAGTSVESPYVLKGGEDLFAFVDYNGATNDLQVRLSDTATRPVLPLIDYTVDLTSQLNSPNAFVGFTSGTGAGYDNHDILSFQFRDNYSPISNPGVTDVPEPASLALLGLGLAGLGLVRRKR